jgi:hypothetical protein
VAARSLISRALDRQAPTISADTPRAIAKPVGAAFRTISRLRSARSLHPDGVVFDAHVEIDRPPRNVGGGVELFDRMGPQPAIVRLSRGVGLSHSLPDVHGIAIRFVDAYGNGLHQDLLLATSGTGPLLHHLLLPSPSFFALPYSTILLYRVGEATRVFESRALTSPIDASDPFDQLLGTLERRELRFELSLATPLGAREPIGHVTLGRQVPEPAAEAVRFNPWNTGGGLRPTGPFMGLRDSAYRESRRGWNASSDRSDAVSHAAR